MAKERTRSDDLTGSGIRVIRRSQPEECIGRSLLFISYVVNTVRGEEWEDLSVSLEDKKTEHEIVITQGEVL